MKVPCKDCESRHIGCHAECDKYKAWKAEYDAWKSEVRKKVDAANSYYEYQREKKKNIDNFYKNNRKK